MRRKFVLADVYCKFSVSTVSLAKSSTYVQRQGCRTWSGRLCLLQGLCFWSFSRKFHWRCLRLNVFVMNKILKVVETSFNILCAHFIRVLGFALNTVKTRCMQLEFSNDSRWTWRSLFPVYCLFQAIKRAPGQRSEQKKKVWFGVSFLFSFSSLRTPLQTLCFWNEKNEGLHHKNKWRDSTSKDAIVRFSLSKVSCIHSISQHTVSKLQRSCWRYEQRVIVQIQ